MLIDTSELYDGLAVVSISGDLVHTTALHRLEAVCASCEAVGRRGILCDLSQVRRVNMSGLAALVELVARTPNRKIGFCGVPAKLLKKLNNSGLDRALSIFPDVARALEASEFRSHYLTGTRTVLLCAGRGSRVAPLTDTIPKPMLDVAGRPILHRIIDHLSDVGLRDLILNPGYQGDQIIDYFRSVPMPDHRIHFANEGRLMSGRWRSDPIGSATTLKRLHVNNAAFDREFVVLCGDALIDLDISEMMKQHRDSGAAATIACMKVDPEETKKYGIVETTPAGRVTRFLEKPLQDATESRIANTGIYIFEPSVLDLIPDETGLDIGMDLLPAVIASGMPVHTYVEPFSWIDVGCGRDYARASELCLKGSAAGSEPIGTEIRKDVWVARGAKVSSRAKISGPCHIGPGARVEAGAWLEGTCLVGAGAVVEGKTLLQDSIVMPGTLVQSGAWAEGMILHGDWAVAHEKADGTPQNCARMDCVRPIDVVEEDLPQLQLSSA